MQKSLKNVIFNGIAQSVLKICQWDPLKVFALKHFTKSLMKSFFRKEHPAQKKKLWKYISLGHCPKYG